MKDLFVDRFTRFNVGQGVVRLDFARIEDVDGDKNEIKLSPSSRVVMPIDGFMHFAEQVEKLRTQILEKSEKVAPVEKPSKNKKIKK